MSGFTYWSSQSFRTLNHWQSSRGRGPSNFFTLQAFNWLYNESEDVYVPLPPRCWLGTPVIQREWTAFSNDYLLASNDIFLGDTLNVVGRVYHTVENDTIKTNIGLFDLGSERLKYSPAEIPGTMTNIGISFGRAGYGGYTTTGNSLVTPVALPTFHKYLISYAWCESGYESILPTWMIGDSFGVYQEYRDGVRYGYSVPTTGVAALSCVDAGLSTVVRYFYNDFYSTVSAPVGYSPIYANLDYGDSAGSINGCNTFYPFDGTSVWNQTISDGTIVSGSTNYVNSYIKESPASDLIDTMWVQPASVVVDRLARPPVTYDGSINVGLNNSSNPSNVTHLTGATSTASSLIGAGMGPSYKLYEHGGVMFSILYIPTRVDVIENAVIGIRT